MNNRNKMIDEFTIRGFKHHKSYRLFFFFYPSEKYYDRFKKYISIKLIS